MRYTDRVGTILEIARRRARQRGHGQTSTMDVLCATVEEGEGVAAICLREWGINLHLLETIEDATETGQSVTETAGCSDPVEDLLRRAIDEASLLPKPRGLSVWPVVGTEHLLLAVLRFKDKAYHTLSGLLARTSNTPEGLYRRVYEFLGHSLSAKGGTGDSMSEAK